MDDRLVERVRLHLMGIECECGVDVNQRPRNYTKSKIRETPELKIYRYFCKNCKDTFGFYAKGYIPEHFYSDLNHLSGTSVFESEYARELRREYSIVAEPMGLWIDILWEDLWNDDWGEPGSNVRAPIPIFKRQATRVEILDIIDPDDIFNHYKYWNVHPFAFPNPSEYILDEDGQIIELK